jgi:hypothetical protein
MTSIKPSEPGGDVIPDILLDIGAKKRYQRGRFLGKVLYPPPNFVLDANKLHV